MDWITWESLDKPLAIVLTIALPLAWGLGVEYAFELMRRWKFFRYDQESTPE